METEGVLQKSSENFAKFRVHVDQTKISDEFSPLPESVKKG